MKKKKLSLFRPIDFGIKFEITLKILIVALFSSLLLGSTVYKLFESSLLMNENRFLRLYSDSYLKVLKKNNNDLSSLNRELNIDEFWLLDKNFKPIQGEGTLSKFSLNILKSKHILILKKGVVFPDFQKIYVLISLKNQKYLVLSRKMDNLNIVLWHVRKLILLYVVLTTFLMIFLLNFLLKSSIINPLYRIIRDINEIKTGKRKKIEGRFLKELNYLINNFNDLLQQVDKQANLLNRQIDELHHLNKIIADYHQEMSKFEKLVSIGELSAGIAHEIGNPLNNIQGYISILKRNPLIKKDNSIVDSLNRIEKDLGRIDRIVKNVLDFSRKGERLNLEKVDLLVLINRAIDLLSLKLMKKDIEIYRDFCCESFILKTDQGKLEQVLLNLLSNAVDSIEKNGTIKISLLKKESSNLNEEKAHDRFVRYGTEEGYAVISITDDGAGISESELPHVFDPFFTTKAPGRGTGLGLSVSLNIMRELGGTITLRSQKGEGTTARIILPIDHPSRIS